MRALSRSPWPRPDPSRGSQSRSDLRHGNLERLEVPIRRHGLLPSRSRRAPPPPGIGVVHVRTAHDAADEPRDLLAGLHPEGRLALLTDDRQADARESRHRVHESEGALHREGGHDGGAIHGGKNEDRGIEIDLRLGPEAAVPPPLLSSAP